MDETIELVGLLHALILDFFLLFSDELGFESLVLLLLLLNLAGSFLFMRLLSKGVMAVVSGENVHPTDDGTVIDEDLLATNGDEAIVLTGGSHALGVLILEHLLLDLKILNLLLLSALGILFVELLLGGGLLLLLGWWLFMSQSLMSVVLLVSFMLHK